MQYEIDSFAFTREDHPFILPEGWTPISAELDMGTLYVIAMKEVTNE